MRGVSPAKFPRWMSAPASMELFHGALASHACSKVESGVALVVEDCIYVNREGGIGGKFAKYVENRTWFVLAANGGNKLGATGISEYRWVAEYRWFGREPEGKAFNIHAVNDLAICRSAHARRARGAGVTWGLGR
jgi:hypothetical protein